MRACSMNLVAVSDDTAPGEEEGEVLGDVSVVHPARILRLLPAAGGSLPELSVSVTARCTVPVPGRGQICSEEILLIGGKRDSLFAAVSSLLVPDVPSILLWRSAVQEDDRLFRSLATVADRVLVDSTGSSDALPMLGRWHALMFHGPERRGFWGVTLAGDLSWTRIAAWRRVLAAAVHAPDMRPLLASGSRLLVEYAGATLAQALLFAGWFCGRIGWEVRRADRSADGLVVDCDAAGRRVVLSQAGGDAAPGLTRVVLSDPHGRRLAIARTTEPRCAVVTRERDGVTTQESVRHSAAGGDAAVLGRELEVLEHDSHYEAAMRWVGRLLEGFQA
jgi:glucose-6-phosphate dehydrogenase assembly protein OpcA